MKGLLKDPQMVSFLQMLDHSSGASYFDFEPRPDNPDMLDEQSSFCNSRDDMSFLIGGNAAGTTEAAAYKTGQFLLHVQPPPRHDCPFWVLAPTYDLSIGTCWVDKLLGHGHIPRNEVQWNRISWYDKAKGYPARVPLRPWPGQSEENNWCIEFKSYEQSREAFQAASIGGFWFSEQFDWRIFEEVFRGCRDYYHPGGYFAEFTPIDPVLALDVEKVMENPPPKWGFYRCNTRLNTALAPGWLDQFESIIPDEMIDTRITGAFANFEGVIFPTFSKDVHVVTDMYKPDPYAIHYRGIDWGSTDEHPTTCTFGCIDQKGTWFVYDEYWNNSQVPSMEDHFHRIISKSLSLGYPPIGSDSHWYAEAYCDPQRPDLVAQLASMGVNAVPATNDVLPGINTIKCKLKVDRVTGRTNLYIHERCKHLIEEMRKYRWMRGRAPTNGAVRNPAVAHPAPVKRDDDTVDAMRYMIHSVDGNKYDVPVGMTYSPDHDWNQFVQRAK